MLSWVVLDRAIRLATAHERLAPLQRGMTERDTRTTRSCIGGWNAERGAFMQNYDDTVLESSRLRTSRVGSIAPQDPMWLTTFRATDDELVSDSHVSRYNPGRIPDGPRGPEGTLSFLCMYVDALARSGRLEDARLTAEKMLTDANHVGLFCEEIGNSGEQLTTSRRHSPISP